MIISGGNKKLNGGKVESKNKRVAFFRLTYKWQSREINFHIFTEYMDILSIRCVYQRHHVTKIIMHHRNLGQAK